MLPCAFNKAYLTSHFFRQPFCTCIEVSSRAQWRSILMIHSEVDTASPCSLRTAALRVSSHSFRASGCNTKRSQSATGFCSRMHSLLLSVNQFADYVQITHFSATIADPPWLNTGQMSEHGLLSLCPAKPRASLRSVF